MAISGSRVSRPPSLSFRCGRHCRFRGCTTILSRYNPDDYCTLHRNHVVFDLEELLLPRSCPDYLIDPRHHPDLFDTDELQILEHLTTHPREWVFFTYDGEIDARRIGNAVRRLRRKGYTIEGRKGGGYRLHDHLPRLEWKGAISGHAQSRR